jgi:uncharacterized membrane protein (DUF373 family)
MTGISAPGQNDRTPAAGTEPEVETHRAASPARLLGWSGVTTVRRWISGLEHAQDVIAVTVGVLLIGLAVVLLIAGIVDFADGTYGDISGGAEKLLDQVLLVLILVEIVHTVVLSLRAHRLVAQPFIVVGLIAVVRRILLVLTPGSASLSTSQLAVLLAMVAVFVAGLIAVSRFERGE